MSSFPSLYRALVIGAGVTGLTTARCLQERGFAVTVIAHRFQHETTSVVAGALWEWPPAVCGFYEIAPAQALRDEQRWCLESYHRFQRLSTKMATGVYIRPVVFYLETPAAKNALEMRKINELRPHVSGFAHDAALVRRNGVNPEAGYVDAYTYQTPLVDTDMYLAWLLAEVLSNGATIEQRQVHGPLSAAVHELQSSYQADVVVNCTGLGSRELADDQIIPVRGAWLLAENDGKRFPKITTAHCSSLINSTSGGTFLFIVPRGRDRLILGGIAQPECWSTNLGPAHGTISRAIFEKCAAFMPGLRSAEMVDRGQLRVGLRPFRRAGVRVEREHALPVVHNYGHGGSGVTLSWGAASDAALLAQSAIAGFEEKAAPGAQDEPVRAVPERLSRNI